MAAAQVDQHRTPAWHLEDFSSAAGVQGQMVYQAAFDHDGLGWFAMANGLYRYDGYGWTRFGQEHGLPSNHVRSVLVASDGRLWVGTDQGAGLFDGERFDNSITQGQLPGPSVRRIVETSGGDLWFCCDRWPRPTVHAGLARLSGDRWTTYGLQDGLPSDYVSDVVQAADGRVFVLTNRGLALLEGDSFRLPLVEAGLWPRDAYLESLVDLPHGGLLATSRIGFFEERGGRWTSLGKPRHQLTLPRLYQAQDGQVLAWQNNPQSGVVTWEGGSFRPVSHLLPQAGATLEAMAEDPQGNLWIVGQSMLVRWQRKARSWEPFPELGKPLAKDGSSGIWFEDPDPTVGRLLRLEDGQVTAYPGRGKVVPGPNGEVWYRDRGLVRWQAGVAMPIDLSHPGQGQAVPLGVDSEGRLWGSTRGVDGELLVFLKGSLPGEPGTQLLPLAGTGRAHHVQNLEVDPGGGALVLVRGEGGEAHRLYGLTDEGASTVPLPPAALINSVPNLHVDRAGQRWLSGHFGVALQAKDGEPWQDLGLPPPVKVQVEETPAGIALLIRGEPGWVSPPLDELNTQLPVQVTALTGPLPVGQEQGTIFLGQLGGYQEHIPGTPPSGLVHALPAPWQVQAVLEGKPGERWVRTPRITLLQRVGQRGPRLAAKVLQPAVQVGSPVLLDIEAQAYGRPHAQANNLELSWRWEEGAWSPWQVADGSPLRVPTESAGPGWIQVRARDAVGNPSAQVAQVPVRVQPLPLRQRAWFLPAVLAIGLCLVGLASAALYARGQLHRQASQLEQAVRDRTAALTASEARYRALFEQSQDAVLLFELDGSLLAGNRAARNLLGAGQDALPSSLDDLFLEDHEAKRLHTSLQQDKGINEERYLVRRLNGEPVEVLLNARLWQGGEQAVEAWQVVLRDVSELSALEERLRQNQKMEAVGRMAGGIAHDFNNILTIILGNGELVRASMAEGSLEESQLDEVLEAAHRARCLTEQIQTFSRPDRRAPTAIRLGQVLPKLVDGLSAYVGEGLRVRSDVAPELGSISLDPVQLEQVLVNLALNAADAMQQEGDLVITARPHQQPTLPSDQRGPSGPCVLLEVTDSGRGMGHDVLSRIFEPFFTTKPQGKGTGLGLAIVYGIVQQAGGRIDIQSRLGAGSTFRILLPQVQDLTPLAPLPKVPATPVSMVGQELLLVVEDEEPIRDLLRRTLEPQGYRLQFAHDGESAMRWFRANPQAADLLLTDIVMPGMSGLTLSERLRELRHDLPIILMSGYPRVEPGERTGPLLVGPILAKPFLPSTLLARVRQALDEAQSLSAATGS